MNANLYVFVVLSHGPKEPNDGKKNDIKDHALQQGILNRINIFDAEFRFEQGNIGKTAIHLGNQKRIHIIDEVKANRRADGIGPIGQFGSGQSKDESCE